MASIQLYYRINSSHNMKLSRGDSQIELNKDFLSSTKDSFYIKEFTSTKGAYIDYTISIKYADKIVLGKTWRIKIMSYS